MFRRGNTFYITAGTDCCACIGGSSIYILSAPSLKGPWKFQGDIGSNPTPFNQSSPNDYVTRAQGSAVFQVDSDTVIWLGNQWNSGLAESPPGARHLDLLYWAKFAFDDRSGAIKQLTYETEISFDIAG